MGIDLNILKTLVGIENRFNPLAKSNRQAGPLAGYLNMPIQSRQYGGYVEEDNPYLVGELGEETVVPKLGAETVVPKQRQGERQIQRQERQGERHPTYALPETISNIRDQWVANQAAQQAYKAYQEQLRSQNILATGSVGGPQSQTSFLATNPQYQPYADILRGYHTGGPGYAGWSTGLENRYGKGFIDATGALTDAGLAHQNIMQSRQVGGPVQPGQPYTVGEQGPEVIVPQQSGTVIPNQAPQQGQIPPQVLQQLIQQLLQKILPMLQQQVPQQGPQMSPVLAKLLPSLLQMLGQQSQPR